MDGKRRRFTISVSTELAEELTAAKRGHYSGDTQGEMLRDLIARGLQIWKKQSGKSGQVLR